MKRKPTACLTARMDQRSLAVMCKFFLKQGVPITTAGALVRDTVDLFAGILVEQGKVDDVATTQEALDVLRQCGLYNTNTGGRNMTTLAKQLRAEDIMLDGFDPTSLNYETIRDVSDAQEHPDVKRIMDEMKGAENGD